MEFGRKLESMLGLNGAIPWVLRFDKGSGKVGWDSRYWDRDNRRQDCDYIEEDEKFLGNDCKTLENEKVRIRRSHSADHGLYNEGRRAELDSYREEYEDEREKKKLILLRKPWMASYFF